jgi:hypothetical protein
MARKTANLTSKEYTSNTTLPANTNRTYFFIVMTSGAGSVEFNNGGGQVPLLENQFYEPYICPTSEVTIVTSGTCTVVEG